MERRSIGEYLGSFLQRGQQHAYVQRRGYRTARWTYRQIAELAFRCARELANRGIAKGERVLIWGPNSAEWVAAFFGCALRGVIVVPMDDAAAQPRLWTVPGNFSSSAIGRHGNFPGHVKAR